MHNPGALGPGFKVHLDLFAVLRGFVQDGIAAKCQWFSSLSHKLIPNPLKASGWIQSTAAAAESQGTADDFHVENRAQAENDEYPTHWVCNHLQQEPLLATCWSLWRSYHEECLIQTIPISPGSSPSFFSSPMFPCPFHSPQMSWEHTLTNSLTCCCYTSSWPWQILAAQTQK